jgi:hypothetical protein
MVELEAARYIQIKKFEEEALSIVLEEAKEAGTIATRENTGLEVVGVGKGTRLDTAGCILSDVASKGHVVGEVAGGVHE